MREFNYLDYSYADDSANWTLLHGATDAVLRQMCQVLIKDGFLNFLADKCKDETKTKNRMAIIGEYE